MRTDAPGRIPESLIDAAIDGELNEDIQREIAHALNYDPIRKQELLDTNDAINALQMPVSMPDFTNVVLARADRHRRFIPASWRRHVRAGRLGLAAALLMTLMTVAGLQRYYPRLTTLAAHPTPVLNIEQAVGDDAGQLAQSLSSEVNTLREHIKPMAAMFPVSTAPGNQDHNFDVALVVRSNATGLVPSLPATRRLEAISGEVHFAGIGHNFSVFYILDTHSKAHYEPVYSRVENQMNLLGSNTLTPRAHLSSTRLVRTLRSTSQTAPEPARRSLVGELDIPALP